uniref:Uncharacterized protein n=1 Tax=Pyxicephalus adspersus TaxID=30357 RepID=A0AAV2ZIU0_PYXAD|nr:TPA: hypothetical protein GDO54_004886 [Pyxicephalus adspersus]
MFCEIPFIESKGFTKLLQLTDRHKIPKSTPSPSKRHRAANVQTGPTTGQANPKTDFFSCIQIPDHSQEFRRSNRGAESPGGAQGAIATQTGAKQQHK